jgi:hypothetical protein
MAKQYRIAELRYEVRKSRKARNMRLSVHTDGSVVVTAPWGLGQSAIERIMQEKLYWLRDKLAHIAKIKTTPLGTLSRDAYLAHKEEARLFIEERLEALNQVCGYTYHKVLTRNQKSRWGSCSNKGTLSFNYKVALLPQPLADYVIMHELCHLQEQNHSPAFWALVEQRMPDYKERRAKLKAHVLDNGDRHH